MSRFIKVLLAFGTVCTVAVLCLVHPVAAAPADKAGAPEASEPKDDSAGDAAKPERKATTLTKPRTRAKATRHLRQTQRPRRRLLPVPAKFRLG